MKMTCHHTLDLHCERDASLKGEQLGYVLGAMHWLEKSVGEVLSKKLDEEYYNNISFSYAFFMDGLQHIIKHFDRQPKFLDVGCGLGTKCFLAGCLGYVPTGLDCNPNYLKVVKQMGKGLNGGFQPIKMIEADGITFDHYDEYDVIYWYLPIRDPAMMIKLSDAIFEGAKPGTVLFPASLVSWRHGDKCERIDIIPKLQYFIKK